MTQPVNTLKAQDHPVGYRGGVATDASEAAEGNTLTHVNISPWPRPPPSAPTIFRRFRGFYFPLLNLLLVFWANGFSSLAQSASATLRVRERRLCKTDHDCLLDTHCTTRKHAAAATCGSCQCFQSALQASCVATRHKQGSKVTACHFTHGL